MRPPPGTAARALHQQWCWFSEATLLYPLGVVGLMLRPPDDAPAVAAEKSHERLGVVDAALEGRDFLLGGNFTGADVMMGYSLVLLERLDLIERHRHRRVSAYLERLKARDAFVRATA